MAPLGSLQSHAWSHHWLEDLAGIGPVSSDKDHEAVSDVRSKCDDLYVQSQAPRPAKSLMSCREPDSWQMDGPPLECQNGVGRRPGCSQTRKSKQRQRGDSTHQLSKAATAERWHFPTNC